MATIPKQFTIEEKENSALVYVHVSGKLDRDDYRAFEQAFDEMLERRNRVRMLITLDDFEGWTAAAAWEDLKFDVKHFSSIERIAVVGEESWEKWVTVLFEPFTLAEMRYFDKGDEADARTWLME